MSYATDAWHRRHHRPKVPSQSECWGDQPLRLGHRVSPAALRHRRRHGDPQGVQVLFDEGVRVGERPVPAQLLPRHARRRGRTEQTGQIPSFQQPERPQHGRREGEQGQQCRDRRPQRRGMPGLGGTPLVPELLLQQPVPEVDVPAHLERLGPHRPHRRRDLPRAPGGGPVAGIDPAHLAQLTQPRLEPFLEERFGVRHPGVEGATVHHVLPRQRLQQLRRRPVRLPVRTGPAPGDVQPQGDARGVQDRRGHGGSAAVETFGQHGGRGGGQQNEQLGPHDAEGLTLTGDRPLIT